MWGGINFKIIVIFLKVDNYFFQIINVTVYPFPTDILYFNFSFHMFQLSFLTSLLYQKNILITEIYKKSNYVLDSLPTLFFFLVHRMLYMYILFHCFQYSVSAGVYNHVDIFASQWCKFLMGAFRRFSLPLRVLNFTKMYFDEDFSSIPLFGILCILICFLNFISIISSNIPTSLLFFFQSLIFFS